MASSQAFSPLQAAAWLTTGDRAQLLQPQSDPIKPASSGENHPVIAVEPDQAFQAMEGFGFALTGGSADLIAALPQSQRKALLQELFSPEGIDVSYLRLSLGASDLSGHAFSYDDPPNGEEDFELARFDLYAGDMQVVPLLREILSLKPQLNIMVTPWSAPAWMKTNRAWVGGSLRTECFPVYAQYFVRYLQGMAAEGITIKGLTVQNEPQNPKNEPSMVMTAQEQASFIKDHLGPALLANGLGEVEIYCWDHNCDQPQYPLEVLADAEARRYISGVAWHLYGGDIAALSQVQQAYPEQKMLFTEQWVGRDGQFSGDLVWHVKHVLAGSCINHSRLVLEWNLASDPDCGPHTAGGEPNCVGALTIGETIQRNVAYYIIGHASKFVPPGSRRIASSPADYLPNVAFLTPDQRRVLIVLNESQEVRSFTLQHEGRAGVATLPPYSVATFVWG